MQIDKIIQVMQNEKECVIRNSKQQCNRECNNCDLVLEDNEIIEAYTYVIHIINSVEKLRKRLRKSRKEAKRYKRKYLMLKIKISRTIEQLSEYGSIMVQYTNKMSKEKIAEHCVKETKQIILSEFKKLV